MRKRHHGGEIQENWEKFKDLSQLAYNELNGRQQRCAKLSSREVNPHTGYEIGEKEEAEGKSNRETAHQSPIKLDVLLVEVSTQQILSWNTPAQREEVLVALRVKNLNSESLRVIVHAEDVDGNAVQLRGKISVDLDELEPAELARFMLRSDQHYSISLVASTKGSIQKLSHVALQFPSEVG